MFTRNSQLLLVARFVLILALVMGMLELQPIKPVFALTITVTNTNDSGAGSLRQAIADATPGDTITFDASLSGQVITLGSDLAIDKDLIINGSGLDPQITISGNNIVHLKASALTDVTISDLTIANGYSENFGGAIKSNGILTIVNDTLRNNYADGNGGAIKNSGSLTISNTMLYHNQAAGGGGAVSFSGNSISSNLLVEKSTIWQNQAGGGGFYITGSVGNTYIVNNTVNKNQADYYGCGIYLQTNTSVVIRNSTFAANSAPNGGEISSSSFPALSIVNSIFACTPTNNNCYNYSPGSVANTNSIIGVGTLTDFGLMALADNGGSTQTMALGAGSSAIDTGNDANCPATDQRGVARPQGSHCDIGAYEYQDLVAPNVSTIVHAGGNLTNATNIDFNVTFSESVTDVDAGDFVLTTTGVTSPSITNVSGSGATYTVTVNTGSGNGTIRLDVVDDDSIKDTFNNPLGGVGVGNGNFTTGEVYDVNKERILNGSFEIYPAGKKIPTSWQAVKFSTTDGKNITYKQDGTASVRITGTGVSKTLSQTLLLSGSSGDAFNFSFWVKGKSIPSAGVCRAQILFYNGTTLNPIKPTINCVKGTYDFNQKTLAFVAPGNYTKIVIRFTYTKASGQVWFDAVSLAR